MVEGDDLLHIINIIIEALKVDRVSVYYAENVEKTVRSGVVLVDRVDKSDDLKRNQQLNAYHFMEKET